MNKDRIFWGCCFILMGILLVTNQIWGTMDIGLFKIIVTVFCAAYIIRSVPSLSFFGIFIPIALILTMYRHDLGFDLKTSVIWGAAILVSIGLELIFKDAKKKLRSNREYKKNIASINSSNMTGEHIKVKNTFGETTKYVKSDSFLTGKFENAFGSLSVYLNDALIQNEKAEIRVENSFGETNIYVPKDWKVENSIHSFLGEVVHNNNYNAQYPVVYITGENSFGSVNIFYI